jgi:cell division protein FtsL
MTDPKQETSFWTKYKRFAGTEIMLYVIMVIGIILGIVIISYWF